MNVLVNLIIFALILGTGWFFLAKREEEAVMATQTIRITVEGGYRPSVVQLRVNQPVTLEFERTDPTSCLEEVVIPDFNVRQYLPLKQVVPVVIKPTKTGEFQFHCGMSMFFGKLVVV